MADLILTPRQVADRRAALKASTKLQEQHKALGPYEIDRDTPDRERFERACREERQIDVMQGRP